MEVDGATITAIAGISGTVATAVGAAMKVLWAKVSEQHQRVETALDECQNEHAKAAEKIDAVQRDVVLLNRHVGRLEGAIRARGIDPEEITE
ncbi:MAG: hypothetical protein JNL58_04485 [Planctomyces sp.]|nr:hypothetical protein [Planctomyces sp.]